MAKIVIDESSVESLLRMAWDLEESADRIMSAAYRLQDKFEENREGLGPHESSFESIYETVKSAYDQEGVSNISKMLRQAADAILETIEFM